MKKLALLFIVTLITLSAFSAYLQNVPCVVTGEFLRLVHDKDNYTIVKNVESRYYVFVTVKK